MSNSQDGKNGKEKEIDRLLKLIDSIARIDEKLTALDRLEKEIQNIVATQYKIDIDDTKKKIDDIRNDIMDAERRRNELIKQVVELQKSFDRWKIYFGLIAFIGSPVITTIIIFLIEHFLNHAL